MIVIVTENVHPALRGRLAVWMLEVRAGVYVGDYGARVREMLWKTVEAGLAQGNAVMVWSSPNDSGFELATAGANRRRPVDLDGLTLVQFHPSEGPPAEPEPED